MKKLFLLALLGAGLVAFVGVDVVKGAIHRARSSVRESLTADVPLREQLAQAQAQVDAYAESIIRGEIAAENLEETIAQVEREVRVLETRATSERQALVALRDEIEIVPTSAAAPDRRAVHQAGSFRAVNELLDRRRQDLARLRQEHEGTVASLEEARAEQGRLAQEVVVLAAEIESLEARTAAARTREAVSAANVNRSGYAEARARLQQLRDEVKERNKLLQYYEVERRAVPTAATVAADLRAVPTDPVAAIDEALAAWPAVRD